MIFVIDEDIEMGEFVVVYIVKMDLGENAVVKVLEVCIYGILLEVLCGYVWVLSRDLKQLLLC